MPTLTIDNREVTVPDGASVLDAARALGIEIPALCAGEGRQAHPTCYVCMVRVGGSARLSPACATGAADGMLVESEADDILAARRTAIELLLSDHFGDCIAPCTLVCPACVEIPRLLVLVAQRRLPEAVAVLKNNLALPAIVGRICEGLCENGCRRRLHDSPVSICRIERFVADWDLAQQVPYTPTCSAATGRRVAIADASMAGLTAAYFLQRAGHSCTVFAEQDRIVMPDPLVERDVLDAEIAGMQRLGVSFHFGERVSYERLCGEFDAVLAPVADQMPTLPNLMTIARSPSRHAVHAAAEGRRSASAIDRFLGGSASIAPDHAYSVRSGKIDSDELAAMVQAASPDARNDTGRAYSEDEAVLESRRCLQCECQGAASCKLREWAGRCGANVGRFRGARRGPERDDSHPLVLFEGGKCIACGVCVRIAQAGGEQMGVSFQGRGFGIRVAPSAAAPLSDALRQTARQCAEACPTGALTLREDV